ncbi:MAG: hypothetical protein AUI47_06860 [Acidobacteria bacterium 13_1_40CM_2_68_5]|nr:MAG: hypothetical protein AUI47_06860 [Acidobacteria bacterium 13_1_40CM_2_68_5]
MSTPSVTQTRNHRVTRRVRDSSMLGSRNGPTVLLFILRFVGGWILSLLILSAFPNIEDWAIRATVGSLRLVLGIQTLQSAAPRNVLPVGAEYWAIVTDCTPLMPTIVLWLAMAAFPSALRWKCVGMMAGVALLWAFNILRLVVLYFIESWIPAASSIVHVYFFQTLAFLFVCIIFMLWLDLDMRHRAPG